MKESDKRIMYVSAALAIPLILAIVLFSPDIVLLMIISAIVGGIAREYGTDKTIWRWVMDYVEAPEQNNEQEEE